MTNIISSLWKIYKDKKIQSSSFISAYNFEPDSSLGLLYDKIAVLKSLNYFFVSNGLLS